MFSNKMRLHTMIVMSACVSILLMVYLNLSPARPLPKHFFSLFRQPRIRNLSGTNDKWIVVTATTKPTDDFLSITQVPGWKILVLITNSSQRSQDWKCAHCYIADLLEQKSSPFKTAALFSKGKNTQKNVGYLIAIQHGAKVIYETSDDKKLLDGLQNFIYETQTRGLMYAGDTLFNPYRHFGQPSIWPRDYPVSAIGKTTTDEYVLGQWDAPSIQQGLVNGHVSLDIDLSLSQTEHPPFNVSFNSAGPPAFLPAGVFSPLNSQNTLFHHEAFWGLFLPITCTFGMCDTLRGYWTQRLLWEMGGTVGFFPPNAYCKPKFDSHGNNRDDTKNSFVEKYLKFLTKWECPSNFLFFNCLVQLSSDAAVAGFWGQEDVEVVKAWVQDLRFLNYSEPRRTTSNVALQILAPIFHQKFEGNGLSRDLSKRKARVHYLSKEEDPPWRIRSCSDEQSGQCKDGYGSLNTPTMAYRRLVQFVQSLCPKLTEELTKQTEKTVESFPRILLIVEFNHPLFELIPTLDKLYRAKFPHILYCGENYNMFVEKVKDKMPYLPTFIEVVIVYGNYGYECTLQAMNMNYKVDGYIYLSDDVLLNTWNIKRLSIHKPWYSDHGIQRISQSTKHWIHWAKGRVAMKESFYEIEALIGNDTSSYLGKLYRRHRDILFNITSFTDGVLVCGGDFAYTPATLKKDFLILGEVYRKYDVFLEISQCVLSGALAPAEESHYVKAFYIWSIHERDHFWKLFNETYLTMHPVKFHARFKSKEGIDFMCDEYFPKFLNIK